MVQEATPWLSSYLSLAIAWKINNVFTGQSWLEVRATLADCIRKAETPSAQQATTPILYRRRLRMRESAVICTLTLDSSCCESCHELEIPPRLEKHLLIHLSPFRNPPASNSITSSMACLRALSDRQGWNSAIHTTSLSMLGSCCRECCVWPRMGGYEATYFCHT